MSKAPVGLTLYNLSHRVSQHKKGNGGTGGGYKKCGSVRERVVGKNNHCLTFWKKEKPLCCWHRWAQEREVTLHRWLDSELTDHSFICTLSPRGWKCDMRRLFIFSLLMSVVFFNQHHRSVSSAGVAQRSSNAEDVWNYTHFGGKRRRSKPAL